MVRQPLSESRLFALRGVARSLQGRSTWRAGTFLASGAPRNRRETGLGVRGPMIGSEAAMITESHPTPIPAPERTHYPRRTADAIALREAIAYYVKILSVRGRSS